MTSSAFGQFAETFQLFPNVRTSVTVSWERVVKSFLLLPSLFPHSPHTLPCQGDIIVILTVDNNTCNNNITTQVYLVLWTDLNKDSVLLVPHDHNSTFDCHHHVEPHPADLKWEHRVASLHHRELLILKKELTALWNVDETILILTGY